MSANPIESRVYPEKGTDESFDSSKQEEIKWSANKKITICALEFFGSIAASAAVMAGVSLIISPAYISLASNPDYSLLKVIVPISAVMGAAVGCIGFVLSKACNMVGNSDEDIEANIIA